MNSDQSQLHLADVREQQRYEFRFGDGDALAAFVDYRLSDRWIALLHTEVLPGLEGQGVGSSVATAVFDDARSRGLKVIPKCPFIVRWLERHPEQHDVLLEPFPNREKPPVSGGPLQSA
ncbi:MAG: GNAT family N-acetyltransferase [Chloroflexota bacterium]